MRWTLLGHASWLVEAGSIRMVFDPLLAGSHHAGVFDTVPRTEVDLDALAANVVVVTHRHPDHFDVPTLHRIAAADTERLLVTADPFVADVGRRLGFRWVKVLEVGELADLDGVKVLPTPSRAPVLEWGVMVATDDGVVWNQVDSDPGPAEDLPTLLADCAEVLDHPALAKGPDVGIVRWNPILQVAGATASATGFPLSAWASELRRAARLGAGVVVPGACGSHYLEGAWQNRTGYPGSARRFLKDLAAMAPDARGLEPRPGLCLTLTEGQVEVGQADPALVRVVDEADDRAFAPHALPPVECDGDDADGLIDGWVRGPLSAALAPRGASGPWCLVLEVALADEARCYTLSVGAEGVRVDLRDDPEWDQRVVVTGARLREVITGAAPWGRALLSGNLRALDRAYRVSLDGVRRVRLQPFFVYDAIPYEESFERWVEGQLRALGV